MDCETCDARISPVTNDDALREKTAKLWAEQNSAPITAEMVNCMGCRADGVKTPFCESMCEIHICARAKGFITCGDCPDKEQCETLGYPDALEQLKAQQKSDNAPVISAG